MRLDRGAEVLTAVFGGFRQPSCRLCCLEGIETIAGLTDSSFRTSFRTVRASKHGCNSQEATDEGKKV